MTLGVRAIVLDEQNRVFLVRHTYCPAGICRAAASSVGEDALTAITRELEEEGNIESRKSRNCSASMRRPGATTSRSISCGASARARRRRPTTRLPNPAFSRADALPEDATRATRARLAELLQARRNRGDGDHSAGTCALRRASSPAPTAPAPAPRAGPGTRARRQA